MPVDRPHAGRFERALEVIDMRPAQIGGAQDAGGGLAQEAAETPDRK